MSEEIGWLNYNDLVAELTQGPITALDLTKKIQGYVEEPEGSYVVYWPTEHTRFSELETSHTVATILAALLNDDRTIWDGTSTPELGQAVVSEPQRDLSGATVANAAALAESADSSADRVIAGEFSTTEKHKNHFAVPHTTPGDFVYRVDLKTVPGANA